MRLPSKLLAGLTLLLLPALLPALAAAQNFPAKPIKLIVPFPRRRPPRLCQLLY
jgi:tripartite-type tricarboxylate transporter receptor subunit TctC